MTFLRIVPAFLLLLATEGLRKASKRNDGRSPLSVQTNTPNEFPASPACLLTSGFEVRRGCQYPQAMQVVGECGDSVSEDACYKVSHAEKVRGYFRDVRTTNDYNSLTRTVTEAEGGGYGQSVSASFSYMKRSQVSEKSLAFFVGSSGISQTRSIINPGGMKLTSAAKDILQTNPREFIARHGLRYIHSITYGGSFLGSVTLNSKQTVDDSDIDVMAEFSVTGGEKDEKDGVFSVDGSAKFQRTLSKQNLNISVFINAQWGGGSNIPQDYESPATLYAMFKAWEGSWRAHPSPIKIITRRWSDSTEVQGIINSMSAADKELFNVPDVTPAMSKVISEEGAQVALIDSSLRKALTWKEIRGDQTILSCLNGLSRDVSAQLIRIDLLTDPEVSRIQQQWLSGDYSWFVAGSLKQRYTRCVQGVKVPTPAPTPRPTPAPSRKTCKVEEKNGCTAFPLSWYQAKCEARGYGWEKKGDEKCAFGLAGRYICEKRWTCTQPWGKPNCCR